MYLVINFITITVIVTFVSIIIIFISVSVIKLFSIIIINVIFFCLSLSFYLFLFVISSNFVSALIILLPRYANSLLSSKNQSLKRYSIKTQAPVTRDTFLSLLFFFLFFFKYFSFFCK